MSDESGDGGGVDPKDAGLYKQVRERKRRRTPSAPMAALGDGPHEGDAQTTMDPGTRDRLILKLLARAERIDTEVEELAELADKVKRVTTEARLTRENQKQITADLREIKGKLGAMQRLLAEFLSRIPE